MFPLLGVAIVIGLVLHTFSTKLDSNHNMMRMIEFIEANTDLKYKGDPLPIVEIATQEVLNENKSPSRKAGEDDNRTSHFYFALYWAKALAKQKQDLEISKYFEQIAKSLEENEEKIIKELMVLQGKEIDLGGYYHPDPVKVQKIMRPSETFNKIIP